MAKQAKTTPVFASKSTIELLGLSGTGKDLESPASVLIAAELDGVGVQAIVEQAAAAEGDGVDDWNSARQLNVQLRKNHLDALTAACGRAGIAPSHVLTRHLARLAALEDGSDTP